MNEAHISDDRLIDICVQSGVTTVERGHLAVCVRCESKRTEIVGILHELDEAATLEANAAFPSPRLERQHARILHRVEQDGRPGQLVAFPVSAPPSRRRLPPRPHVRWAAAAAAAAFVAGVLTGQWTHGFTARTRPAPVHMVATEVGQAPLRPVRATFSEDEFLDQIETAALRNGPAALRPLDAMTPRSWEVR